jgi:hypothetical protein
MGNRGGLLAAFQNNRNSFEESRTCLGIVPQGISNIEHGILNDEVFPLCYIASTFDIPCSIFSFCCMHGASLLQLQDHN